jgi:hypothetical protein
MKTTRTPVITVFLAGAVTLALFGLWRLAPVATIRYNPGHGAMPHSMAVSWQSPKPAPIEPASAPCHPQQQAGSFEAGNMQAAAQAPPPTKDAALKALPSAEQQSLWKAVSEARYMVHELTDHEKSLPQNQGVAYVGNNPCQKLIAGFLTDGGVRLSSGRRDRAWQATLKLDCKAPALAVTTSGNRVETCYPNGITEWFENTPEGIEHGFTVAQRPTVDGVLDIRLALAGLRVEADPDSAGNLRFMDKQGKPVVAYRDLKVRDASGRALEAQMRAAADGSSAMLVVNDSGAKYPLDIDPIIAYYVQQLGPGNPSDELGGTVAIDGDTALIGYWEGVYVFVRNGGDWELETMLAGGFSSAAISGNTVLLGSPGTVWGDAGGVAGPYWEWDPPPPALSHGSAAVFVRTGGVWSLQTTIDSTFACDSFGATVEVVGDTALIGCPSAQSITESWESMPWDPEGPLALFYYYEELPPSVLILQRSGSTWVRQEVLTGNLNSGFGSAVAMASDTALIGAPTDVKAVGTPIGSAYVFTRSGDTWNQQQQLFASDGLEGDRFGAAVALSGDTAVVGAHYGDKTTAANAGSAYVFTRSTGIWDEQAKLTGSSTSTGALFGASVVLSGDTAVVSSPAASVNIQTGYQAGMAYVFVRRGGLWMEQSRLYAYTDAQDYDYFGLDMALSGDTLLVGSPWHNSLAGYNAGNAYVWRLALVPAPLIVLEQPVGTGISDGETRSFGQLVLGVAVTKTFTIRNMGELDLTGLAISKDGGHSDEFAVSAPSTTTLSTGASTTFTVTLTPAAPGPHAITLRIASDYRPKSFDIVLTGDVPAPEIVVQQPSGYDLTSGTSAISFLATSVGATVSKTFAIRNTGTSNLSNLAVAMDGTNAADFTLGSLGATTLVPGAGTTFTVSFTAVSTDNRTAVIHIASNDSDENPFDVSLCGMVPMPEIAVQYPALNELVDASSTITFVAPLGGSAQRLVTIRNTGTGTLTGLALTIDGTHASDFSAGTLSGTGISPGASKTFEVAFTPSAAGERTATLHIASNDADENPFDITLTGSNGPPTLLVTTAADTPAASGLSLRQAIGVAVAGDMIGFDPALAGQTFTLSGGELLVNKSLNIDATALPGGIVLAAGPGSRIFKIEAGANVGLGALTIQGGRPAGEGGGILNWGTLRMNRCTVRGNRAADGTNGSGGYGQWTQDEWGMSWGIQIYQSPVHAGGGFGGGGICNYGGSLTLIECTVSSNASGNGGDGAPGWVVDGMGGPGDPSLDAVGGPAGNGGGICNFGTLSVSNSIIADNSAGKHGANDQSYQSYGFGSGAGIFNDIYGTVTVDASLITGNRTQANSSGGGFANIGTASITGTTISSNTSATGGGIGNSGALDLTKCTIMSNFTAGFFGIYFMGAPYTQESPAGPGGGISNSGTATLVACSIIGNHAGDGSSSSSAVDPADGGGVQSSGTLVMNRCSVTNNRAGDAGAGTQYANTSGYIGAAGGHGGGILLNAGSATIRNSTIAANQAGKGAAQTNGTGGVGGSGGGLAVPSGSYPACNVLLINSTISENSAGRGGDGLGSPSALSQGGEGGSGGGISHVWDGQVRVVHCTIAGNCAGTGGTGITNPGMPGTGGGLCVGRNATDTGPAWVRLDHNLVAMNVAALVGQDVAGQVSEVGAINFIGDPAGATGLGSPLTGDPLIGALANYGGSTLTHSLLANSPALNAGVAGADTPATDQRGQSRPFGVGVDLGAFESQGSAESFVAPDIAVEHAVGVALDNGSAAVELMATALGGSRTMTFTIRNAGSSDLTDIAIVIDGTDRGDFTIVPVGATTLVPAAATTFELTFTPSATATRTATIHITSNDADENPFNITLTGTGVAPSETFDAWLRAADLTNAAADPLAIPHGDGVKNLLKYAFHLDGNVPDRRVLAPATGTAGLPCLALDRSGPQPVLRFEYLRRKNSGLTYTPRKSHDLTNWLPLTGTPAVSDVVSQPEWERVIIAEPIDAATTPRCYGRVEVAMP